LQGIVGSGGDERKGVVKMHNIRSMLAQELLKAVKVTA